MKKRRKKKKALPLIAALSVIALSVALVVLAIQVIAQIGSGSETGATTATGKPEPVLPHDTTDPSVNTKAPDLATTPSVITTPAPVTTPAVSVTEPPVTTEPPSPITTTEKIPEPTPVVDYVYNVNMEKYEKYIDPTGDLWDDAYLLLVNAANPIAKGTEDGYDVLSHRSKFSSCKDYEYTHYSSLYFNDTALQALTAMFLEAESQGIKTLDITSAYRSYSKQSSIFNSNCNKTYHWMCDDEWCAADWIGKSSTCPVCGVKTSNNTLEITQEEKEANVATYSCAPGTSDHQTGLAVDIIQRSLPSRFDGLIQEFGETEAGKWLAANAKYFGFVLRFPQDKEDITGIIYEPWHFRYVGRTHAMAMDEMNLCLEEYVEYLHSTGYFQ
ncbi:MAG: D-alanyl-D-alanine carboxypeptidase family protein [Clostridia bacterium]|nr:D-alanyl-D-alanine carboxypeptidase family protein [Clostridia bacterium]